MLLPPKMVQHGAMPKWSHDDKARQAFQRTLRETVVRKISPGTRAIYDRRVKPRFEKEHDRGFADRYELRREMEKEPYYQLHAAIQRVGQELMWSAVTYTVDQQLDDLIEQCQPKGRTLGSLTLDPSLELPDYAKEIDIHCMPGGYCDDLKDGDVAAGAIIDVGGHLYGSGRGGPLGEQLGQAVIGYLKREHADLKPKRILDMGCTIGKSTLPYCDAYPDAEVHAIDVGAALLRYGHARAESLGKAVHFSQQNAERTNFEGGSFDLVVSHIMFHEMSSKALFNSLKESMRLIRPGGLIVHADAGQYADMDLYRQFIYDSEVYYNNEPFWSTFRDMDLVKLARKAGYQDGKVKAHIEPAAMAARITVPKATPSDAGVGTPSKNLIGIHMLVASK